MFKIKLKIGQNVILKINLQKVTPNDTKDYYITQNKRTPTTFNATVEREWLQELKIIL